MVVTEQPRVDRDDYRSLSPCMMRRWVRYRRWRGRVGDNPIQMWMGRIAAIIMTMIMTVTVTSVLIFSDNEAVVVDE